MKRSIGYVLTLFVALGAVGCFAQPGGPDEGEQSSNVARAHSTHGGTRAGDGQGVVAGGGVGNGLQAAELGLGETRMEPQPQPWSDRNASNASDDPSDPSDPDRRPCMIPGNNPDPSNPSGSDKK